MVEMIVYVKILELFRAIRSSMWKGALTLDQIMIGYSADELQNTLALNAIATGLEC